MRSIAMLALLLALPFALTSCFYGRTSDNEPLWIRDVEELEPGVSTAREVVERLGAPADVVQLGKRSAYLYRYTVRKREGFLLLIVVLFGDDLRSDRVWLFFDEDQVLSHVGSTLNSHRATYALPWSDLHDDPYADLESDQERARGEASYWKYKEERMQRAEERRQAKEREKVEAEEQGGR